MELPIPHGEKTYLKEICPFEAVQSQHVTNELIETAFSLIGKGAPTLSSTTVHQWLESEDEHPFPSAQTS